MRYCEMCEVIPAQTDHWLCSVCLPAYLEINGEDAEDPEWSDDTTDDNDGGNIPE